MDAALAAIALLPLFFLLDHISFHSRKKTWAYLLFALYLSAVYSAVGLPDVTYVRLDLHFNLIPFAYMFSDYRNSILNVALFIPMGFFLPLCWRDFRRFGKTTLFGFSASLLIELLQIFTYRATDINDLMTNTAGTILGWCAARLLRKAVPGIPSGWKTAEAYLVCAAAFFVMFLIHPFLSNLFYSFLL